MQPDWKTDYSIKVHVYSRRIWEYIIHHHYYYYYQYYYYYYYYYYYFVGDLIVRAKI